MPHPQRTRCRRCGKHRDHVGPISWGGNCRECGKKTLNANVVALESHSGPEFVAWRRGVAASVGGVLLDVQPLSPQTDDRA